MATPNPTTVSTRKNRLFALGSNSQGQLGVGHRDDVDVPIPCRVIIGPPFSKGDDDNRAVKTDATWKAISPFLISTEWPGSIRKIVSGGNHTLILLESGIVYASGNPEALQGAIHAKNLAIDSNKNLDPGACFERVAWVLESGKVVDRFKDVAATWTACFFVTANDCQIFNDGQSAHNAIKTISGTIWGCGRGGRGELGCGKDVATVTTPTRLAIFGTDSHEELSEENNADVVRIAGNLQDIMSSLSHTVATFVEPFGIYGWGASRKGQLGEELQAEKNVWTPKAIAEGEVGCFATARDHSLAVALGRDFSLLYDTVRSKDQQDRWWRLLGPDAVAGRTDRGLNNLFIGKCSESSDTQADNAGVTVHAGWSKLYLLEKSTGQVRGWGRSDLGQLLPHAPPRLRMMAAGSEHCVGLTISGRVVAWGWGEHGNCGRECDQLENGYSVLNMPNVEDEMVTGIGAGCATTFLFTKSS